VAAHLQASRAPPALFNSILVNGLILAAEPPLTVLMLGRLGFAPWQYSLAFASPCLGGLIGARLSRRLVLRFGRPRVLRIAGSLRVAWPVGLAFVPHGWAGVALVMVLQFGLVTCIGVFNPIYAASRLEHTPRQLAARTLSAWSVSSGLTVAGLTALWGVLASATSPRIAIGTAGVLLMGTPLWLWRERGALAEAPPPELATV
jgi:MFS family permease